ncbi:MAG: DUF3168 domain-containing protein [Alphaproteobacteria bacterium]|nr:DUF3168 domain-containing protein [Alphaproteobacteria bacterium]
MSASWALQQAVLATLVSSDEVKEALGDPPRVFDAPPRSAAFPYCVIGDDRMADWSTATEAGSEHALSLHLWSRAPGHKEAKLAAETLRLALDGAALDVTGQALIGIRHLTTDFTQDGESVHAVLKFRAVLEPQ